MTALDAVFWDFGGVFTASPFHAVRPYSASLGIEHDELLELVFGPYHLDTDHPWHRLERGEGTLAEAMDAAVAAAADRGVAFDARAFFGAMRDDIDRTIVVATVRELRTHGVRHCIITNNAKEFASGWRALVPVDELFDDVIDSSAVGMRKPNPAIYELAMARLDVRDPSRAAFLDDFAPNVSAARALGLHGIVVEHPEPAMAALRRLAGLG
jgi:epoxide hydrolase-like predicted phosphatase